MSSSISISEPAQPARDVRGRTVTQLLGAISTILALLLFLELALRALPIIDGARRATPPDAIASARLVPGLAYTWSLGWDLRHVVHGRINRMGFPAPYDYAPHEQALALLGDSFAEGIMLDYRESLAGRLNEALGSRFRSFNFGLSGAALPHYLGMAREMRQQFQFGAAVVIVNANDYVEGFNTQEGLYKWGADPDTNLTVLVPAVRHGLLMQIARASALFRYLRYHLKFSPSTLFSHREQQPCSPARLDAVDELRLERYVDALPHALSLRPDRIVMAFAAGSEQIYERVDRPRARGARHVCPTIDSLAQDRLRALAAERGMKVLDVPSLLETHYRQHRQRMDFSPVDQHWNGAATTVIASAIADLLKTDQIVSTSPP